ELEADPVEAAALGVRAAADRDQYAVGFERLAVAAGGGLERERGLLALDRDAGDLGREPQLHALLLEDFGRFLAHFAIHPGEQRVEELDYYHFGTEAAPDAAELEPNHAAADHHHFLWHRRQLERAGGIDHDPLGVVDLDERERRERGAGGDDHILRGHRHPADIEGVRVRESGEALEPGDLVLLEQVLDDAG